MNTLNEEGNSIKKPSTAHNYHMNHDMQLIGEDSDINSMKYGGNVSEEITQNLRSHTNANLIGVINGGRAMTRKETGANPTSTISGDGVNAVQNFRVVTEFEDTLRGIDAAISKFDKADVESVLSASDPTLGLSKAQNQINQLGPVGCDSKGDIEMPQTKGPRAIELKPRGWKRLVTERAHVETQSNTMQSIPMQRKRQVRDEENENEGGATGKRFCVMDTILDQTAEAAGQPRREP